MVAVDEDQVKAEGKQPITSTWTMKKKSEGKHYNTAAKSSPVTSNTAIRMVLTIMLVAGYDARAIIVKHAFLNREFITKKKSK